MQRHPELAASLVSRSRHLASEAAREQLHELPDLLDRFPAAEQRCIEDGEFHVRHLAGALSMGRPELFDAYLAWTAELFDGLGLGVAELRRHVEILTEVIAVDLDAQDADVVRGLVRTSLADLPDVRSASSSHVVVDAPRGALARSFLDALLGLDRQRASRLILAAADDGTAVEELYLDVFQPCLREIGRLWQTGQASVAQEHFVTAAVQLVMAQLYPRLLATPRIGYSILVCSVGGELHEIGGRMVADIFECHGWHSHFTGANTPSRSVADLAARLDVDIVAISVTMPNHLGVVEDLVQRIRSAGTARILVGGRPFNQVPDLWQVVGADGTAADAGSAVASAAGLLGAA